jgi:hypothetical protein
MTAAAEEAPIFVDLALSRRLERAEGRSCVGFVDAHARLAPDSGACWVEVAGALAAYDGPKSPITQTFGLGLFQQPTASDLDVLERFFQERGASVDHEISPLADLSLMPMLNERGYHPFELSSVMYRPTQGGARLAGHRPPEARARLVGPDEAEVWAQTGAKGWSELTELADQLLGLMRVNANRPDVRMFLAELDGRPVGAAALGLCEGVALMAGACTIPEGRNRGAQLALLDSRLRYGAEHGCDLAMMCAQPGSASQRNAERHGFRIAYTRIKWRLGKAPAEGHSTSQAATRS